MANKLFYILNCTFLGANGADYLKSIINPQNGSFNNRKTLSLKHGYRGVHLYDQKKIVIKF